VFECLRKGLVRSSDFWTAIPKIPSKRSLAFQNLKFLFVWQVIGAIVIVPKEGGKDIAFAFLVSVFSLYVTLRTSPFVVPQYNKLHVMALTTQSLTLFYALVIVNQQLSSATSFCSKDVCRNLGDILMVSLQLSVVWLPIYLTAKESMEQRMSQGCSITAEKKKIKWPLVDDSTDPSESVIAGPSLDEKVNDRLDTVSVVPAACNEANLSFYSSADEDGLSAGELCVGSWAVLAPAPIATSPAERELGKESCLAQDEASACGTARQFELKTPSTPPPRPQALAASSAIIMNGHKAPVRIGVGPAAKSIWCADSSLQDEYVRSKRHHEPKSEVSCALDEVTSAIPANVHIDQVDNKAHTKMTQRRGTTTPKTHRTCSLYQQEGFVIPERDGVNSPCLVDL